MKTISKSELQQLRDHLLKKPFKYEEVFREVLDHYATAYETSESSLEEVIAEQDQEFLNSRIVRLNERFESDLFKALGRSHLSIFTNYFRWPQIVVSALVVTLFLFAGQVVHQNESLKLTMLYSLAFIPMAVWLYFGIRLMIGKKFLPWNLANGHFRYLSHIFNLSIHYVMISTTWTKLFSNGSTALEFSPLVTSLVLLVGFVLLSSSLQLAFTKIKPAIA